MMIALCIIASLCSTFSFFTICLTPLFPVFGFTSLSHSLFHFLLEVVAVEVFGYLITSVVIDGRFHTFSYRMSLRHYYLISICLYGTTIGTK